MTRSSTARRRRFRRSGVLLALLAVGGLVSITAAQTAKKVRPQPDPTTHVRATPPPVCDPQWPTTLSGIESYYSVVIQLQNCQVGAIPLSIDLGPEAATGTSLASVGGVDAEGSTVLWNAGDGTATSSTPVTSIPHGDGRGGIGALVGFTTVPFWDGMRPDSPGPYTNQWSTDGSTNTASMKGTWAVYLPSATFELDLQPPLPFPYVPQYTGDGQPQQGVPGAIFSGLIVTRSRPGGLQDPIFTTSSQQGYGLSPPSSSFFAGNCYDPVSLVNGANAGYATPSNWSFFGNDQNPQPPKNLPITWYFTPAGNDFEPLESNYQFPALMLVNGFVDTNDGIVEEIPLRDQYNTVTATVPHYLQIAVRNVESVDCSGSDKVFDIPVAIGADLTGINLASAQLPGAVFANSDLTGASLTQISFAAGTGDTQPNLSYADLSGQAGSPLASGIGIDFEAAQLIGTDLSYMDFTRAGFKNANLLLANLTGSTFNQVDQAGAHYCYTTMPDGTMNNIDCNLLLTPQAPWQADTNNCEPTTCVFISLYNNTTRLLARGLDWCTDGQFVTAPQPPTWIGPLVTGQFGVQPDGSGSDTNINCGVTFANGAGGKIRIQADTTSGSVVPTIDSGTCFGADATACLPRAADGVTPVKWSVTQTVKNEATFLDVIACEPTAYTGGACPTTPVLPGMPTTPALPGS